MSDHTAARNLDFAELQIRDHKMGSQSIVYTTIEGVRVSIANETGSGHSGIKTHSIREAIKLIVKKGFQLPDLDFRLASSTDVENVAFMAGAGGKRKATVFLGGKYWSGGKATGREGVAGQVYDGTQIWFGNPKQKAQGVAIVVHELGHVLHEISAPDIFWSNKTLKTGAVGNPNPSVWGGAAVKVSQYSAVGQMTCLEFVAEAFAGAVMGKKYDAEVKKAYAACGGPETSSLWKN